MGRSKDLWEYMDLSGDKGNIYRNIDGIEGKHLGICRDDINKIMNWLLIRSRNAPRKLWDIGDDKVRL